MKRSKRAALWMATCLVLAGATLTPRVSASYQVPVDEPVQKGDPDYPGGNLVSPIVPQTLGRAAGPVFILRLEFAPGVSLELRVRIPQLIRASQSRGHRR